MQAFTNLSSKNRTFAACVAKRHTPRAASPSGILYTTIKVIYPTKMSNQPVFWLQVRKDYISDNFESLVYYLRNYNYSAETGNPDYDSTLDCMRELCDEIADSLRTTPIGQPLQLPGSPEFALRLIGSTLLASKAASRPLHSLMLAFCSLLLHLDIKVDNHRIYKIIIDCLSNRNITSLGFNWENISSRTDARFNANFLALAFCRSTFGVSDDNTPVYFAENHGLLMIPPHGLPAISTLNCCDYKQGKSEAKFIIPEYVNILHGKSEKLAVDTFADLAVTCRRMLDEAAAMKSSLPVEPKSYAYDEVLPVRITRKRGSLVVARTIDHGYVPVEGKLFIDFECRTDRPSPSKLRDMLTEGDILLVHLSREDGYAFETHTAFEDYYRYFTAQFANTVVDAIAFGKYPKGTKWFTAQGFRICVDYAKANELDEDTRDAFIECFDNRQPTRLRLYAEPSRLDAEQFNVYAAPDDDFACQWTTAPEPFTLADADISLIRSYLDYSARIAMEIPTQANFSAIDANLCYPLVHLFHRLAMDNDTNTRYRYVFGLTAAIMADICNMPQYRVLLISEMDYLAQLAAFAANADPTTLSIPEGLKNTETANTRRQIVETLKQYRRPNNLSLTTQATNRVFKYGEQEILQKVQALVLASNNLIGILDIDELDNIKRVTSRLLGMAEEYESIVTSRTFFGRENQALEFKTTLVYPPARLRRTTTVSPEPETQKWVILRTVCGFLNSRCGGDLLIGVNDAGYASGLADDISILYKMELIGHADMDHYINYIQNLLDTAFCEKGSSGFNKDIPRAHIEVSADSNAEGREVVRLHIRPYRKATVEFSDFTHRPQWVSRAYIRQNARTTPLTDAIERSLRNN